MAKSLEIGSVARDAPIRLSTAAALAFPDGSMTVSGLRREAARGRLMTERIAGKDFTTLADIDRMRELCRASIRVQGFTNEGLRKETDASSPTRSGQSATANG